jgi:hypothetical protein
MQIKEMVALDEEVVNKEKCWLRAMIGGVEGSRERGSCE